MAQIVCLIAQPEREPLEQGVVTRLAGVLGGTPRWLAEREACEIAVEGEDQAPLLARAQSEAASMAIDVCVVPAADRVKRVLVCDLDSTIITIETIDELADFAGVKAEVAAITRRAMRGELDFEAALKARVALLEGLSPSVFDDVYRDRARLMPGACTLVRTMRARGAIAALVSGGFMPLAERIRDDVGFNLVEANRLEVAHGRLTGRLTPPIVGPAAKLAMLERLRAEQGLPAAATLAVGDGANDLPMLRAAGLGVAFRAHAPVARQAPCAIEHGDLRALLFLQGIAQRDFATWPKAPACDSA